MASSPDPDALLDRLRTQAGPPPLPPLALSAPPTSHRAGPAGRAVTGLRRGLVRLIAPSLLELIGQLEHDRHRVDRRLAALEARVAELEGQGSRGDDAPES